MPGHGVCAEEQRGGNAPFALEQMACRKPFNVNRGLKGKREGEFTTGCSGSQLKRKTVLLFSENIRIMLRFGAQQKANVCLSLCVGTPLSLSYPQLCSPLNKLCKKSISGSI